MSFAWSRQEGAHACSAPKPDVPGSPHFRATGTRAAPAMPTKLRMARFGCKRRPFYRIVATDSRKARNGQPIEYVSPTLRRRLAAEPSLGRYALSLLVRRQP